MEDDIINEDNLQLLPKPDIKYDNLKYIVGKKEIYVNIFEFSTIKDLKLYKYPFQINPLVEQNAYKLIQTIFKVRYKDIFSKYGIFTISGDSLFSMNKIEQPNTFKSIVYFKGKYEYTIEINKFTNEKIIKKEDVKKDSLTKQFIEIIIKDILLSNPNLDFDKGLFVLKGNEMKIESERVSINYYPGFINKFIETEKGNFINVSLKNKIESSENILEYLNKWIHGDKYTPNKIRKDLIGRWFYFYKKKYKIDEILFDRNPVNQTLYSNGKTLTLKNYYIEKYKIDIKNNNQPLILNYKKGPQGQILTTYYIPELCTFSGLDEMQQKDNYFMKELSRITKIDPETRVKQTNKFLELLKDENKKGEGQLSSKEKLEQYGIIVQPPQESFYGYLMEEPKILAGRNKTISTTSRQFPLFSKKEMKSWLCFYEKSNYNEAETLFNCLSKASKAYGLNITEPEWVEMHNKSRAIDWIETAESYLNSKYKEEDNNNEYAFVIYLIKNNNKIYDELKRHSLCKNGYVSQVVKTTSLKAKGMMSICSKILLQINAKLGGISYKTIIDKTILDREIMVVGVDSSSFNKKTGVAMVSTIDNSFADFFNSEKILNEKDDSLQYCVSSFLEDAIPNYFAKNKKNPKNIIIYRQGISDNLIYLLKNEVMQIEQVCKKYDILFYYILVNTRTTFKFFEKNGDHYINPGAGLLVINGITQRDKFEFYIQPQQVTGGSATPTKFHVAYGNMNFPEIIPKFTYDLCHIYSNWQGTVRIPNVIKAAEKLSKMTVKSTQEELNEKLKLGQSYL